MTVREAGRFERVVVVSLTDSEIDAAKSAAARRLSKDLKLHGFRPGKAPRPVVEAAVGSERLRSEAIEDLIPQHLVTILESEDLNPAVNPSLESINEVEGGVEAEVRITLWPELDQVPKYQGRELLISNPEVTDGDVSESLERMRNQFASLETVERPAADGDFVSIDISAELDGKPVPEAAAEELLYEVGSGHLIEGSDEQLLGQAAGARVSFEGALPEGFGEKAGAKATFNIEVKEVKAKVLPEADDDWVAEITEFETLDELKSELRARLVQSKQLSAMRELREKALELVVAETEIDIPEALLRAEMQDLLHRFTHRLEENDISLQDYLEATGIDGPTLEADLRSQADRSLRTRLALESVAKAEGIQVSSEELAAEIEGMSRLSDKPEQVRQALTHGSRALSLAGDILRNKALEAVIAGVKAVDTEGNPVELGTEMADGEVEAQVVEAQVVETEPVEADVFEAEIVEQEA